MRLIKVFIWWRRAGRTQSSLLSTGIWWFIHEKVAHCGNFSSPFSFHRSCFFSPSGELPGISKWGGASLRTAGLDLTEKLECDLWLTSGLSCLLTTTMKCWMEDALSVTWMSEEGKLVEQEPGPDPELMKEAEEREITVTQGKTHTGMEGTLRRCMPCFIHPKTNNLSHLSIKTSNKRKNF